MLPFSCCGRRTEGIAVPQAPAAAEHPDWACHSRPRPPKDAALRPQPGPSLVRPG